MTQPDIETLKQKAREKLTAYRIPQQQLLAYYRNNTGGQCFQALQNNHPIVLIKAADITKLIFVSHDFARSGTLMDVEYFDATNVGSAYLSFLAGKPYDDNACLRYHGNKGQYDLYDDLFTVPQSIIDAIGIRVVDGLPEPDKKVEATDHHGMTVDLTHKGRMEENVRR